MRIARLLALLPVVAALQPAMAQENPNANIVKATLLADVTAVKPDTTFTLGVLFKVQPGWHIYWRNPGSSGLATKVTWALPEGGSNGDTLYPAPIAFTAPGDIISYGYEEEVLLLTEARASAKASGEIEVNAKCRWLMCSDRCIPGKQDVSLKLPIGNPAPANQEIFGKYKKLVPKVVSVLPAGVTAKSSAAGSKTTLQLTVAPTAGEMLTGESHPPDVFQTYFFPDTQDGWVIDTPQLPAATASAQVGGAALNGYSAPLAISITAEASGAATKGSPRLKGVLVKQGVTAAGKLSPLQAFDMDLALPAK